MNYFQVHTSPDFGMDPWGEILLLVNYINEHSV
jgi:hypothetical protein